MTAEPDAKASAAGQWKTRRLQRVSHTFPSGIAGGNGEWRGRVVGLR